MQSTLPKPPQAQPFEHPDSSLHWGLSVPRPGVVLSSGGHWMVTWGRGCPWNQVVGVQEYCSTSHSIQKGPNPETDAHSNVSNAEAETLGWSNSQGRVAVKLQDCTCRPLTRVSSSDLLYSQPSWGTRAPPASLRVKLKSSQQKAYTSAKFSPSARHRGSFS